jgi:murein L,D-transpeptidase YafK
MFSRNLIRTRIIILLVAGVILLAALVWAHWPEVPLGAQHPVTSVVVLKAERELILYSGDTPLKVYRVALGRNPVGQKEVAGDKKTPEGEYVISSRNPQSSCHLALHISYPTPEQVTLAQNKGFEPGGDIMIHGIKRGLGWIGKFHTAMDWTAGCVAVTNEEIEEIYRAVPDGTKVTIRAN